MVRYIALAGVLLASLPFLLVGADTKAGSADWPQFRGPERQDHSPDKNLLKVWPESGPPLVWQAKGVGEGFSSVSIVGDKIYTMGDKGDSSFLVAVDREKGTELWSTKVGKPGGNYKGTRCTPSVDGNRVFGLGQFGDLICCDKDTGAEVWRKNLVTEFHGRSGGWNYTESPLVDGDKLICTPGGGEATLVALNKSTGEVIWRGEIPGGDTAGYSSIVVSEAGGIRQYVQLTSGGLVGFDAKSGKMLWRFWQNRLGGNTANIPTPIVKDDLVFAAAGYGRGGGLIKLAAAGGEVKPEEVYFNPTLQNRHGGVVIVGDYVYGDQDDRGLPYCAEWKTGNVMWKKSKRTEGGGSAAVTYADGHLYFLYQNGVVALVEASSEEYKEVSFFKLPGAREPCWAHPVVVGGRMYLRDQDNLRCYDVRASAAF